LVPYLRYRILRKSRAIEAEDDCQLVQSFFGPIYTLIDDAEVSRRVRENGFYDLSLSLCLCRLLRVGMRVVNVGANIGYFAVLAGRMTHRDVR